MRTMVAAKQKGAGRYDPARASLREPPGGRARVNARIRTVQTVTAAVDDPEGGRERLLATVNRRVDILEAERSHGRISEAAYQTGQLLQSAFERLGYAGVGAASLDGAAGGDPVKAVGDKTVRLLECAQTARAMMDGVARRLGMIDTRLLRSILGERYTYAEVAARQGKAGDRGERYVAARFRDGLEDLAQSWASRGPRREVPDDVYAARAEEVARRGLDRSGET